MKVTDFDVIYISYDEPNAEFNYFDLVSKYPKVKRVHGIKGFDAAHKAAAELSETDHFFIIDGDNIVFPDFFEKEIDIINPNYVYSWSAKNSINDLIYGNGGIKLWPKKLMLNMKSHENSDGNDFCWVVPYYQMDDFYSISFCNITPKQAFRAGFREGVKMSLVEGKIPASVNDIWIGNLRRLLSWMTLGMDVDNGMWGMMGARMGCASIFGGGFDVQKINDYELFNVSWESINQYFTINEYIEYGEKVKLLTGLNLSNFNAEQSKCIKSMMFQPSRNGLMLPQLADEEYLKNQGLV